MIVWGFPTFINYHEKEGDDLERRMAQHLKLTDEGPKIT